MTRSEHHNIPTWLDGYTLGELSTAQRNDPVLKKFFYLIQSQSPKPNPGRLRREGSEFKIYTRIWDELRIVKNVFYRRVLQPPLLRSRFQFVLPMNIRKNIPQACHDSLVVGHQGNTKTWAKIKTNFYLPNYWTRSAGC